MPVWLCSKVTIIFLLLMPLPVISAGSCNVALSDVVFGVYDVFNLIPTDGTGAVAVDCRDDGAPGRLNVDVSVTLSASSTSGSTTNRQMVLVGGTDRLEYNLFRDVGHTQVWGDTAGVDDLLIAKVKVPKNGGIAVTPILTIYGRIPPGQEVSAGNYTDSVVVTVTP